MSRPWVIESPLMDRELARGIRPVPTYVKYRSVQAREAIVGFGLRLPVSTFSFPTSKSE